MILSELAYQYSCYKYIKRFDDEIFKFLFSKYVYCRFDNANQERYKIKKSKINEIQFKNPKLDIKSVIFLVYIYYLNFYSLLINFQKFQKLIFKFG